MVVEYYLRMLKQLRKTTCLFPAFRGSKITQRAITIGAVREQLKQVLKNVAPGENFTPHSLRAGGATAAINNGVPEHLVMKHGRWKSVDVMRNHYIKESPSEKLKVTKTIEENIKLD